MNTNNNGKDCQTILFSVYAIWCRKTNMYYIGVTRQNVWSRIRQHKRGKTQFIDCEIRRIGWENFDWWIVEENIPSELISEREQYWVDLFDCVYPKGYNRTGGGIGRIIVTEETCEKIRQNALARNMSGENNPMYGRHHTDEVKAAQSARMKGKNNPMYGKPPANKGVPLTDEQRAIKSAASKGEKNPFYGKHHTEEAKEKNVKHIWANPAHVKANITRRRQKLSCAKKHLHEI